MTIVISQFWMGFIAGASFILLIVALATAYILRKVGDGARGE